MLQLQDRVGLRPLRAPPEPAAGRLMQGIKRELDPRNILNPGRFVAGI